MGQKLMGTLAGPVGEQRIESVRREEEDLKKAPESLHGLPRRPRLPSLPTQVESLGPELAAPGPSPQVPVIRNGGSNTLNFQFHDPAPRTVCNGYAPPRRDGSQHPGGSAWEDVLYEAYTVDGASSLCPVKERGSFKATRMFPRELWIQLHVPRVIMLILRREP